MIRGTVYLVIFAAGIVAGGLFPSFSSQYHQQLQARYTQVSIDLAPFQDIADSHHDGSLEALIQHHLKSTDPTFHAEGEAIQFMIDGRAILAESQATAETGYADQAIWLYNHRDESVVQATWESFQPALIANSNALTFSLVAGGGAMLLLWLVFTTISYGLSHLVATKRM